MKILYIVPYFYPAGIVGGTAKSLYDLSRILVKNGHKITVLTTDLFNAENRINFPHDKECNLDGIRVIYFSNLSNKLAYQNHFFLPFKFFLYLLKNIKKYDIVHLHEIYTVMHLWAGFLSRKKNIPYIITSHGTVTLKKEEGRIIRKKVFYSLGGLNLLKNATKIVALTDDEKKAFLKLGLKKEKIVVIPNGYSVNSCIKSKNTDNFRKRYNIPRKSKILLFLGRIHPKKGIDLLVDALFDLKKKHPDIILIIAGPIEDKNYYHKIMQQINDKKLNENIFFTGALAEEDKRYAYEIADIFVLISYAEGLPLSILEAASFGVPLLISKYCGVPEVSFYKAGLVVGTNVTDIISAVEKIFSHDNYRSFFGRNGQKMIKEKFDLKKIAVDTEKLYRSILLNK